MRNLQPLIWLAAAFVLGGVSMLTMMRGPAPSQTSMSSPSVIVPLSAAPAMPLPLPGLSSLLDSSPPDRNSYVLQLGAFLAPENAASLIVRLGQTPTPPYEVVETDGGGKVWHKVRMGPYPTRIAAADAAASLLRDDGIAALIIGVPPAGEVATAGQGHR